MGIRFIATAVAVLSLLGPLAGAASALPVENLTAMRSIPDARQSTNEDFDGGFHPDGSLYFSSEWINVDSGPNISERAPWAATETDFVRSNPFPTVQFGSTGGVRSATSAAGAQAMTWWVTTIDDRVLYVSMRAARSAPWSTPRVLVDQDFNGAEQVWESSLHPRVVVTDQGRVVVTWSTAVGQRRAAWASHGTIAAGGTDMSAPVELFGQDGVMVDEVAVEELVAREGGDVFVVTRHSTTPNASELRRVWLRRLEAGSGTWSAPLRVDAAEDSPTTADPGGSYAVAFSPDGTGTIVYGAIADSNRSIHARSIGTEPFTLGSVEVVVSEAGAQHPDVDYASDGTRTVVWVAGGNVDVAYAWVVRASVLRPGQPAAVADVGSLLGPYTSAPELASAAVGGRTFLTWAQQAHPDAADAADPSDVYLAVRGNGEAAFEELEVVAEDSGSYTARVFAGSDADAVVSWYGAGGIAVRGVDSTGPSMDGFAVPTAATIGSPVTFSVAPTDTLSLVPEASVVWTVNGEVVGTGRTLQNRSFSTAGTFTVGVTATDAMGNTRTREQLLVVTAAAAGGGSPGGGSTDETRPAPPTPFTLTDTVSRDKVPAVVGLSASAARDRFDKAGIEADFTIRMINRATAPRGISIGEVMEQTPRAGSMVTSAIRDLEGVRLDVYAGPAVGQPTKAGCSVAKVNAATKGLDLDLAALVLKAMKCPYEIDVKPASKGDDATVTGAVLSKGLIRLGVSVPRKPTNNDLLLIFRENPNGISFDKDNWTLTAGQANAFTVQVVDRGFRFQVKARVTIDASGVGLPKNPPVAQTDAKGDKTQVLTPQRAGFIDILVEQPGADGQSLWGYAQLKVVDRSSAKVGTRLGTVSGRVFEMTRSGTWSERRGASLSKSSNAKFIDFGGMLSWMQQLVAPMGAAVQQAFSAKANPEQTLSSALRSVKVAPGQMTLANSLVGGNVRLATVEPGQVVSAGGANVVAAGSANVVAPGGANVVSAGGGNVVAAGSANVVAAGGGNAIFASGAGVVSAGGGNVISAGGGNVISAGGANVVSAGGGNMFVRP